jgi:hypothetical protein
MTKLKVAVRNFAKVRNKKAGRNYFISYVIVHHTKWSNLDPSFSTEKSVANKRKCLIRWNFRAY